MVVRVLLALLAACAPAVAGAATDPARYMDAKLVAETASPKSGSTVLVGLAFTPRPGWHGYWSNPGDSGIAPSVRWTAPTGVSFGPVLHPAPTLMTAADISSFVHEGPHVLLSRMRVDSAIARGTILPVRADINWAACTATQCVPLRATLTLDLVAGDGAPGPQAALLHAAARKLPRAADAATFTVDGKHIRLALPASLRIDASTAQFFPDEGGILDVATENAEPLTMSAALDGPAPDRIGGVLADGRSAYRMTFRRASAEPARQAQLATAGKAPPPPAPRPQLQTRPTETASKPSVAPHASGGVNSSWLWLAIAAAGALIAALAYARRPRR